MCIGDFISCDVYRRSQENKLLPDGKHGRLLLGVALVCLAAY